MMSPFFSLLKRPNALSLLGGGLLLLLAAAGCRNAPATPQPGGPTPTVLPFLDASPPPPVTAVETPAPSPAPTSDQAPAGLAIQVDVNQQTHPISPLIYGLSAADDQALQDLRPTLLSWGGNPSTRYNWKLGNAWNAGSDWFYRNGNFGFTEGSASDAFISRALSIGAQVRLAIPTLGWVAKNDDNNTCSFPLPGGGCGNANGATCENPGPIADPTLANVPSSPAFIAEWLTYLYQQQQFDIRFLAMDNEPELWGYTHYDVHPTCTTYDEILDKFLTYATLARDLAPQAEITGPVTCCWFFYWNSAAGPADKRKHDNQDFLPWFLQSVRQYDQQNGQRTLDVLDIHYYPEGLYNDQADPETAARRLRSTRSLWDPAYIDESWINQPIYLIPRMKELIDTYYPGTRLGISEWNWGADQTMNGALAIADVLGIFGREDVYLAAYWRSPAVDTPGYFAFQMYTNFDGQGSRFGDISVKARSDDPDAVSSYAALDSATGNLHLMLINKQPDTIQPVNLSLAGFTPQETATLFRYDPSTPQIMQTTIQTGAQNPLTIELPPYSITLLVLAPATP